jgi:hypothetical protein
MFKALRPELLRGLKELSLAARENRPAIITAYLGAALEHRGLVKHERGRLVITKAGEELWEEHVKRGFVTRSRRN